MSKYRANDVRKSPEPLSLKLQSSRITPQEGECEKIGVACCITILAVVWSFRSSLSCSALSLGWSILQGLRQSALFCICRASANGCCFEALLYLHPVPALELASLLSMLLRTLQSNTFRWIYLTSYPHTGWGYRCVGRWRGWVGLVRRR